MMTPEGSDLPKLAGPARRALAGAGIRRLVQLTRLNQAHLSQLHGIRPDALMNVSGPESRPISK